jgi:hypothetical protein
MGSFENSGYELIVEIDRHVEIPLTGHIGLIKIKEKKAGKRINGCKDLEINRNCIST